MQPAGVRQRHGDEQPGKTQHAEQMHPDVDHDGIVHPEDREQLTRQEQEEQSDERGAREPDARGCVHGRVRAVRFARAEILSGDRGRGAHQSHRRPGDEREQLRVRDGERRLRRSTLRERADERQHQHAADIHRDPLNARGKAEPEQRPDDRPIRTQPSSAREGHHPSASPELPHRVERDGTGRDHGAHRRALRSISRDRSEPANEENVEGGVQHGHRDPQDHRRTRVAR